MSNKYKNYFDEIKNKKIQDKFVEHIIRLLFFTFILSIEAVYKQSKILFFHVKNFLLGRTLSDILKKYRSYKESVNLIINNNSPGHNLHQRIHETKNLLFNDEEKKLVFGFKDTTNNLLEKSKQIFTSVSGYTKSMKNRYFKYTPFGDINKNFTASMFTLFILKKHKNENGIIIDPEIKKEIVTIHSSGYKKFINDTFNKFYTNDFKKKIVIPTIEIRSLKPHVKRFYDTINRLEKKQIKYTFGQP